MCPRLNSGQDIRQINLDGLQAPSYLRPKGVFVMQPLTDLQIKGEGGEQVSKQK